MIKVLAFQGDVQSPLLVALQHYQAKEGQVTQTAPVEFLDPQEQQVVVAHQEQGAVVAPQEQGEAVGLAPQEQGATAGPAPQEQGAAAGLAPQERGTAVAQARRRPQDWN